MILTGDEICNEVKSGRVIIEPFSIENVEPNSYGFHLGPSLMFYDDNVVDAYGQKEITEVVIPPEGYVLQRNRFCLGSTYERMGATDYAAELYAAHSQGSAGMFIQTSAPLGHMGAAIHWTLEIVVAHPVRIYAGMRIGKICFWQTFGQPSKYCGRYKGSTGVTKSLLSKALQ